MESELSLAFPELPTEIENYIFLWTARLWIQLKYLKGISGLTIVSKRVQSIVEPVLYETVVHQNNEEGQCSREPVAAYISPFRVALDSRPAAFFHRQVKDLYICGATCEKFALHMMETCTGVENLFFQRWIEHDHASAVPLITQLPLHSLSVHIMLFKSISQAGVQESQSIFPNLKYLSLPLDWDYDGDLPNFAWLPALTHLRLEPHRYREKEVKGDIKKLLFTLKTLEMLVICIESWTVNSERTHGLKRKWMKLDPRVRVEDRSSYSYFGDWKEFVQSGEFYVDSDDSDESDSD
ncbi:hypothetical protein BT96DRAFT_106505 [Gymnopus androsaceus JB14]|uniref:F-box domain-containing protein n=1 Tax=Gymnopus androsaceus JB14 TaxID=1447944 RepID=A0A6A4IA84_9AGAR|nr:hypothetical protein BT96DRAFT_106505 [Gymnopus androsaceus JB14]